MKWIRPTTVLLLVISVMLGFFIGKIDAVAFFGFATGLVIYWFKSRDNEKESNKQ